MVSPVEGGGEPYQQAEGRQLVVPVGDGVVE